MKKNCNHLYVLIFRSIIISIGLLLPILRYMVFTSFNIDGALKMFWMAIGMILVNTPFALLVSIPLAKAIGADNYKDFKERVLYGTILPTYLLLVVCIVILELLVTTNTHETLFWLVITWGYLFGIIAFVFRLFILSLKKEEIEK